MSKSESEIQKEILAYAKKHKDIKWIDRSNSGKVKVRGGWLQLHEAGTPDLLGYTKHGFIIGIELKKVSEFNSKGQGLSDKQLIRILDMKARGGYCGVACSVEHVDSIMLGATNIV